MMKPTKTLIIAGSLAWAGMTAHADHRSIDLNPALEYERGTDRLKKHVAREFRYHHGHRGYDLYLALLRTVNCLEDYGDKAGKYRGRPDLLCVLKSKSDPLIVDARRLGRAAGMSREFWIEMRRVETNLAMLDTNHVRQPHYRGRDISRDRYRETTCPVYRDSYRPRPVIRDRRFDETHRARGYNPNRRTGAASHTIHRTYRRR